MPSYIKSTFFLFILIVTSHQTDAKIISKDHATSAVAFLITTACTKALLDTLIPYDTSIDTAAKSLISVAVGIAGMYYTFSQTIDGKMYHAQNGIDAIFNSQLIKDISKYSTQEEFLSYIEAKNSQDYCAPGRIYSEIMHHKKIIEYAESVTENIKSLYAHNTEMMNACSLIQYKIYAIKPTILKAEQSISQFKNIEASNKLYELHKEFKRCEFFTYFGTSSIAINLLIIHTVLRNILL